MSGHSSLYRSPRRPSQLMSISEDRRGDGVQEKSGGPMMSRRRFAQWSAAAAAGAVGLNAGAADSPLALTRLLCGFPPGDPIDVLARQQGTWAQAVVVENRAGAGGRIAVQ